MKVTIIDDTGRLVVYNDLICFSLDGNILKICLSTIQWADINLPSGTRVYRGDSLIAQIGISLNTAVIQKNKRNLQKV